MHQSFGSSHPSNLNDFPNLLQNDKLLVKMPLLQQISIQLSSSLKYLTDHSLTHGAKWAGQLLMGMTTQQDIQNSFLIKSFIANNTDKTKIGRDIRLLFSSERSIEHVLTLAKNLFELREYKKCSFMLKQYLSKYPSDQSVIFYYYYSLWMSGLIRKQEQIYENQGSTNKAPTHSQVNHLQRQLKKLYESGKLTSGINLYLYGLVLKQKQRVQQARKVFIQAINNFPCFWSCWIELCKIIQSESLSTIINQISDHWMKNLFFSSFCLQKYRNDMSIQLNYGMLCFFKNSNFIMNQIAHSFYNNQEFDISLQWFQKLLEMDPFRFQNMDTYSNILYIKQNQGELANLALKQFDNNKYNPETCCVIGNYYSLMGQHLKAIVYFRKALKLDRNCLAAWTLMGHEYLQMKNIAGAVDAYRHAVEIDPKDFRAWYGLGQTYQLQNMNNYALYYFSRAVVSRPKDSRMWNAMGSCYQKMGKTSEATKCFTRAQNSKDRQGIAIHQMAKLYNLMGPQYEKKAVAAFESNLKRKQEQQVNDRELTECLLFLSRYYKKIGNPQKAIQLARRLSDLQGVQKDQANKLLQQLNMMS